jgi:hypothetical protein
VDSLRRIGIVVIYFKGGQGTLSDNRATSVKDLLELLREEVKPDILETKPIEQEEKVIEDPVIKDARVSDHNERDR